MRVKYIVVAGEGCPVCYLPCAKKYLTDRSLHGKWSTILSVKLQENLGVSSIFFFVSVPRKSTDLSAISFPG